jgi:hypothetical protein
MRTATPLHSHIILSICAVSGKLMLSERRQPTAKGKAKKGRTERTFHNVFRIGWRLGPSVVLLSVLLVPLVGAGRFLGLCDGRGGRRCGCEGSCERRRMRDM